ncbi:hypothetical protein DFP72DRAFT_850138 [Ephemerocybe angulata]|uniref:Uncharacterized protein n=1 Tax=Ephemerocybe angulata TaxID=980116 RepID=A0A8H6HSG3_9AGAR|nr:hypothetical protein DFP72DRAFT_850138 [Tulosesus angulatus]
MPSVPHDQKGKEVDCDMRSVDSREGDNSVLSGSQSDHGYAITDDILSQAWRTLHRTGGASQWTSHLQLRSPIQLPPLPAWRRLEPDVLADARVEKICENMDRHLASLKEKNKADGANLDKLCRLLGIPLDDESPSSQTSTSNPAAGTIPNPHSSPNPPHSSADALPATTTQAPNFEAIKLAETALEHFTKLYQGVTADSGIKSTTALLDAHMSNLVWIQNRLISHYEDMRFIGYPDEFEYDGDWGLLDRSVTHSYRLPTVIGS